MRGAIEGAVIFLIGAFAFGGALLVPPATPGETWAGVIPLSVSVLLAITGGGMSVAGLGLTGTIGKRPTSISTRIVLEVMGLFVLALIYWQAIVMFGYQLPTAIISPIVLAAFGVRNPWGLAISVVICPLLFHLIFFEFLGVFPPFGEVFDLLDAIRG